VRLDVAVSSDTIVLAAFSEARRTGSGLDPHGLPLYHARYLCYLIDRDFFRIGAWFCRMVDHRRLGGERRSSEFGAAVEYVLLGSTAIHYGQSGNSAGSDPTSPVSAY
jgi:hypothetical protein